MSRSRAAEPVTSIETTMSQKCLRVPTEECTDKKGGLKFNHTFLRLPLTCLEFLRNPAKFFCLPVLKTLQTYFNEESWIVLVSSLGIFDSFLSFLRL